MTTTETPTLTIQLFLFDGTPNGLRKATIHGWTGLIFVATTSTFAALTSRKELDRPGIYLLAGPDPYQEGVTRAYIGSSNSVQERIKQSAEKRDFWEIAIAVTTSDSALSKGHVEYLEARLIELATQAKRVTLANGSNPTSQRRRLPEADLANMEQFLANLKIMLPVIGLDLLKPQPHATLVSTPVEQRISGKVKFEIRHKTGVQAQAVEEDGEFIVLEDSQALFNTGSVQHSYYGPLKKKLMDQGVLVQSSDDDNLLVFAKPHVFSSPSAAAAVVLDRNSNGRTEWKVQGSKQSYHDWQQTRKNC